MPEWNLSLPENPIIPLWLKVAYSVFVLILVPVYWRKWGPANFLWFSDVALFVMLVAVWLESSLLASMMAIGVLLPETAWNVGYFWRLLSGRKLFSLTDYMFDASRSLFLRSLSLFHVALPVLILYMLHQLGFEERAIQYQIAFGFIILSCTYFFTDPKENINWVFGPGNEPQTKIKPGYYFLLVLIGFAVLLYLPTYFLLRLIF